MAKKVLIVDDDEISREIIADWLLENGYEVTMAKNGREGYEKCRTVQPDAVLLDILMPEMNGDEVAEKIKNDPAITDTPIIFISAILNGKEVPRNNLIGGQYIIAKPFTGEELHNTLIKVL